MGWLIAAILVVALVFFAGFRKVALGLFIAGIIGGYWTYQHGQQVQQQSQTRIPASEINLEAIALNPTLDGSYDLTGRIRNNSKVYRLDGISFKVTLRDCRNKDRSSCGIIGEATTSVPITLPPQQTRDFTGSLYFGSDQIKVKGTFAWDYEVTTVLAKRQ